MESLGTKSTIKAVPLPKDLNDTYDNAMKRIEAQTEEDRSIARTVLTWVANAMRPLTVSEIQVLVIEPGTRQLDDDNLLDIDIILCLCGAGHCG
jgi:hypothetical protein